jgi:hypothetical protein
MGLALTERHLQRLRWFVPAVRSAPSRSRGVRTDPESPPDIANPAGPQIGDVGGPASVGREHRKAPRQQIIPNRHSVSGIGGAAEAAAFSRTQMRRPRSRSSACMRKLIVMLNAMLRSETCWLAQPPPIGTALIKS